MKAWLYQVAVAGDRLINAIGGGLASETISARAYRLNHRYPYKTYESVINWLFSSIESDHCRNSYLNEQQGTQRPPAKQSPPA